MGMAKIIAANSPRRENAPNGIMRAEPLTDRRLETAERRIVLNRAMIEKTARENERKTDGHTTYSKYQFKPPLPPARILELVAIAQEGMKAERRFFPEEHNKALIKNLTMDILRGVDEKTEKRTDKEVEILKKILVGFEASDKIVEHSLIHVGTYLKQNQWLVRKAINAGLEYDELIQFGVFAITATIKNFEAGKESAFTTYLFQKLRGTINRQIEKDRASKGLPINFLYNMHALGNAILFIEKHHGNVTEKNMCEVDSTLAAGYVRMVVNGRKTLKDLKRWYDRMKQRIAENAAVVSLEDRINGTEKLHYADRIGSGTETKMVEKTDAQRIMRILEEMVQSGEIPERDARVFIEYVIEERNYAELARDKTIFSSPVSRERARQLVKRTILKIADRLGTKKQVLAAMEDKKPTRYGLKRGGIKTAKTKLLKEAGITSNRWNELRELDIEDLRRRIELFRQNEVLHLVTNRNFSTSSYSDERLEQDIIPRLRAINALLTGNVNEFVKLTRHALREKVTTSYLAANISGIAELNVKRKAYNFRIFGVYINLDRKKYPLKKTIAHIRRMVKILRT